MMIEGRLSFGDMSPIAVDTGERSYMVTRFKRFLYKCAAAAVIGLIFCGTGITAFASARTEMNYIDISVKDVERGDGLCCLPDISVSWYATVESAECSSDRSIWEPGDNVTITLKIVPKNGYVFKNGLSVNCSGGNVVNRSVTKTSATVKINYKAKWSLRPVSAAWFDDETVLRWDGVPYCRSYQVKLKGENSDRTLRVNDQTWCDISPYVTDYGTLEIKIRSMPKTPAQGKYLYPSEWFDIAQSFAPPYENTVTGYFQSTSRGLSFVAGIDDDGTRWLATGWQYIGGAWYYFDGNGYALSGRQLIGGKWYCLDASTHQMATGWLKDAEGWRCYAPDGGMLTGWYQDGPGGKWYYLDTGTGIMWASAVTPDGYRVGPDGAWIP